MSNTWTLNESEAVLNDEFSEHGIMSTKAMSSAKKKEKTSLGACSHKKFFPFFLIGRMPVNEMERSAIEFALRGSISTNTHDQNRV